VLRSQVTTVTLTPTCDALADVIITGAVAVSAVADGSADEAARHLDRRLEVVTARAGV
jgi:hypothetical protein